LYPKLAPGAIEVKLNPSVTSIGNATNTGASVTVTGLANNTNYFYLVRLNPYTGDWSGQSFLMGGEVTTLNVVTPSPTPVPTTSPTPTPVPTTSPTPVPTTSPTPTPTPTPTTGVKLPQTINFPALVDRSLGRSQPLLATTTSGLQVLYTSLTPNICYLIYPSTGPVVQTVANLSEGIDATCTVRASQPGDNRFTPAISVDRTFKYVKAPMVLVVENASTLNGAGPHAVITRVRLVDNVAMSGLTSLGHLLTVQNLTPTICRVDSHGLWDRTGGIVNRTYVTVLATGTCSLKFDFAGSRDREATTLTWNAAARR
jgi:hypothetical protein